MAAQPEPPVYLEPVLEGFDAAGANCIAVDDRSGRLIIARGDTIELRSLTADSNSAQVDHTSQAACWLSVCRQTQCLTVVTSSRQHGCHSLKDDSRWMHKVSTHACPTTADGAIARGARRCVHSSGAGRPPRGAALGSKCGDCGPRFWSYHHAGGRLLVLSTWRRHSMAPALHSRIQSFPVASATFICTAWGLVDMLSCGGMFLCSPTVLWLKFAQAARSRAPIRAAFWTGSAAGDLALATAAGLELYRCDTGHSRTILT